MKFEYKKEPNLSLSRLNELGDDGWELVTVSFSNGDLMYVFKRRKPEPHIDMSTLKGFETRSTKL